MDACSGGVISLALIDSAGPFVAAVLGVGWAAAALVGSFLPWFCRWFRLEESRNAVLVGLSGQADGSQFFPVLSPVSG